jgi:hypothetical protein
MCAMGSCIKVVKMLSPVDIQKQNRRFSVMGIRKIINSLPLRRKIASQFSSSAYVRINIGNYNNATMQRCELKGLSHDCCFVALLPLVPFIATVPPN